MKEWGDKHIEQLMREAAENFVPPYNPNAWAQMQSKMAGVSSVAVNPYGVLVKRIIIALIILLAGLGSVYYYYNSIESNSSFSKSEEKTAIRINSTEIESITEIERKTVPNEDKKNFNLNNSSEAPIENAGSKSSNSIAEEQIDPKESVSIPTIETVPDLVYLEKGESNEQARLEEKLLGSVPLTEIEKNSLEKLMPKFSYQLNKHKLTTPELFFVYQQVPEAEDLEEQEDEGNKKFSISIVGSPDFSGARLSKLKGTGIDLGLMFEYFIDQKFSINTGVIYGTKKYFVDEDFEGYSIRWPGRDTPDEVDASCTVLDIPINLRYYFYQGGRTQFFVNTGVTSYIMLTEDYLYKYYDSSVADWEVSVENENKHFIGLLNFSFGVQKQLRNGLYFVAEPFYKLPLQGIGAGAVNLNSTGLYFSIKKDF